MFVCVNCFEDPGLVKFIKRNVESRECSFCSTVDIVPVAAPIDEVSEYFIECLFREYDVAENHLAWESSEGGWIGTHWPADELVLYEIQVDFPQDNQDQLLPYLLGEHFDQEFCEGNGYGLNDQEWTQLSWSHFCEVVMHRRRFFFLDVERDRDFSEVYNPGQTLKTILEYAESVGLIKHMPIGAQLFRARCEGSKSHFETAQELGPPPLEKATHSNRMSPAGIPMFYACDDKDTALKETSRGAGWFAVGQFETLRSATLLDLTAIPPVPSLFEPIPDSLEVSPRRALNFLHHIATQISQRIERGENTEIDYVPTQIVTEFVRSQRTSENFRVDGIKYPSSVNPGHSSYVLFANQDNVLSTESRFSEDRWLELKEVEHIFVNE